MTSIGSVLDVAFCTAGSWEVRKLSTSPNITLGNDGNRARTHIEPHENIVFFLVANRELPLCLFILLRIFMQSFDRGIIRQDRTGELDVALCVLVSRLYHTA